MYVFFSSPTLTLESTDSWSRCPGIVKKKYDLKYAKAPPPKGAPTLQRYIDIIIKSFIKITLQAKKRQYVYKYILHYISLSTKNPCC